MNPFSKPKYINLRNHQKSKGSRIILEKNGQYQKENSSSVNLWHGGRMMVFWRRWRAIWFFGWADGRLMPNWRNPNHKWEKLWYDFKNNMLIRLIAMISLTELVLARRENFCKRLPENYKEWYRKIYTFIDWYYRLSKFEINQ